VISAILQDFCALISKVKQSFFLNCMVLNKKAQRLLKISETTYPLTVSHPRRHESSATKNSDCTVITQCNLIEIYRYCGVKIMTNTIPINPMVINSLYRRPRRNVPDFRRVFLMLKYTDITQNTYVHS